MKNKILGILLISTVLVISGFVASSDGLLVTINVKIQQDNSDDTWRVKDNEGRNMGTIVSSKRDVINWQTIGSDMIFTFPSNFRDYFVVEEGQFANGNSQRVEANKKLRLTIKADAPADTLTYEVYVVDADEYVIGNSPPKVIIQ